MRVLTADQMREADARGLQRLGEVALMRAAGERLHEALVAHFPGDGPVVAFAGPGNNGGDAFAALALVERSRPRILYTMESREPTAARRDAEERAAQAGVVVRSLQGNRAEVEAALRDAEAELRQTSVLLDGLLGTGSRAEPAETMVPLIEALNARPRKKVLAIDIPTGVDATTGAVASHAVRAGITVTLGAPKIGLLLDPARQCVGSLFVGDIGLADEITALGEPFYETLTRDEFRAILPRRDETADKREAGAPLVVAGSRQFPGAAVLCARGAARAGAGYVTVATSNDAADLLRAHLIEQVVVGFDERDPASAIECLLDISRRCQAVAIGPGLPLSDAMGEIVRGFLSKSDLPFVADASALFHFAKHLELFRDKRCVITPHAKEFGRLSGEGTLKESERVQRLRKFVERTGITTLLKGRATLIDNGQTLHVNSTGTSALATAGTGDVLTGMVGTLLAQGLSPVDAARAGAYWHGLAGRRANERRRVGVVAGDIPEVLADALDLAEPPSKERLIRIG